MNKIDELTNEYKEKLEELKKEYEKKLDEEMKDIQKYPKIGDNYCFITDDGVIGNDTWEDDDIDRDRLEIGNRFKTEEEAKFERERKKIITELKKYAEPKDRKWDGENNHYYILWDYGKNDIEYRSYFTLKCTDIYFESRKKAQQAVKAVGEHRIKKYYLEVEE